MKKILISFGLCIALVSQSATAETSLYEVSKGEKKLYLGGTIHVLRNSDYPLPPEFEQAYKQSQVIVLETDMQKTNTPEFGQQFAKIFAYTDGKNIAQDLQHEIWQALQTYADKNQFPLAQMSTFKALFVSLTISISEMQKRGYGLGQGVDMHFFQKANTDKKPVQELESIDVVFAHMKQMADLDANMVIKGTLRDVKRMDSMLEQALGYWREGDLKNLDAVMSRDMREETPQIYQNLLVDRNNAWLPKIEKLLTTHQTELVLVGALHLPGDEGLLARLKARGYQIKPYKTTKQ